MNEEQVNKALSLLERIAKALEADNAETSPQPSRPRFYNEPKAEPHHVQHTRIQRPRQSSRS